VYKKVTVLALESECYISTNLWTLLTISLDTEILGSGPDLLSLLMLFLFFFFLLLGRHLQKTLKNLRLRRLKSDLDEIWQECSDKYASIDVVGFSISRQNFKS